MPRGGNHPKHPKCPGCNKALYKTQTKGTASKKEDPFSFCRNEACNLFGEVQEGVEVEPSTGTIKQTVVSNSPAVIALLDCQKDDDWFFEPQEL